MRKIFLLLLSIAVVLLAVLSGCSSNLPGDSLTRPPSIAPIPPSDSDGSIPPNADETLPDDPLKPPAIDDSTPNVPAMNFDRLFKSDVSGLNIRSGAGSGYSSLGVMGKNDALPYMGEKNGWYITTYKGKTAYVSKESCSELIMKKSSSEREGVIAIGKTLLGYPYVYGAQRVHFGNGVRNSAFDSTKYDCSSLTQYAYFVSNSILLDTTSRSQSIQGKLVSDLQRGDLMFFTNSSRQHLSGVERIGHVAIYLGDNYILHTASDYAVIEPISSTRWGYFISARSFF